MKNVVFLSYYFHPCPIFPVAGERVLRFAKYLPEFGWRAIIITRHWNKNDRNEISSASDPNRNSILYKYAFENFVLIRTQSKPLYSEELWQKANNISDNYKFLTPIRKIVSIQRRLRVMHTAWGHYVFEAFSELSKKFDIKVIVSSVGPPETIKIGDSLGKYWKIPHIIDFRDPWILQFSTPLISIIKLPFYKSEIDKAKAIIETSRTNADLDSKILRKPLHIIRNSFDDEEFSKEGKKETSGDFFKIIYPGTLYDDYIPSFITLFEIIKEITTKNSLVKKKLKFLYYGPSTEKMDKLVSMFQLNSSVKINSPVPPEKIPSILKMGDLLFLPAIGQKYHSGVIPSKLYRYLAALKPILIYPDTMEEASYIVRSTRSGFICSTKDDLKSTLIELFNRWKNGGNIKININMEQIKNFSARKATEKLSAILEEVSR